MSFPTVRAQIRHDYNQLIGQLHANLNPENGDAIHTRTLARSRNLVSSFFERHGIPQSQQQTYYHALARDLHLPQNSQLLHPNGSSPSCLESTSNFFSNLGSRARHFVHSASVNFQATCIGLRQEVPFERWYFHHGLENPITADSPSSDIMKARAWAVAALAESVVRTAIEFLADLYSRMINPSLPAEQQEVLEVLAAQTTSLALSWEAILSPEEAIKKAKQPHPDGSPRIGAWTNNWRWGTVYHG